MSGFRRSSGRMKRRSIQIVVTEGLSEEIYLDRIRAGFGGIPVHTVNAGGGDIGRLKKECSKTVSDRERWGRPGERLSLLRPIHGEYQSYLQ